MKQALVSILLASLLAGAQAFANTPSTAVGPNEEFRDAVAGVVHVARDSGAPIEDVKGAADRAFGEPDSVRIKLKAGLRGWDFLSPAPASRLTIAGALSDARRRLAERGVVVPALLSMILSTVEDLDGAGRVRFADRGQLSDHEAGVYFYKEDDPDPGRILLNANLLEMELDADKELDGNMRETERLAAWIAAEATLVHEAAHAVAKAMNALSPRAVIDGEVFAFSWERSFLRLIDPHGEGIATMISVAQLHQKYHPSRAATLCFQLSSMLGDLWRTDGKPATIEHDIVIPAGYRENKSVL